MSNLYVGCTLSFKSRIGHLRLFDDDLAVIKFMNGETQSLTPMDLEDARNSGQLHLIRRPGNPCLIRVSEDQEKALMRFESYCTALAQEPAPCAKGVRERVIERISFAINDDNPPSNSNLSRIYKLWIASGKDMAAVLFDKPRLRSASIAAEIFDLMDKSITSSYLKNKRPTMVAAYKNFVAAHRSSGYLSRCPALSSFERRIRGLGRISVIEMRYGKSAAREESRSANSKIKTDHILQRVEMDAAHFNLGLKNIHGCFIGAPSIYFIIDAYSRVILGYAIHVGKSSETAACVIHALRYAISKKNDPLYPFFGVPDMVVIDQGTAYISRDTTNFLNNLQIEVINTATKMGWGKPMIERFIGTARTRFFHSFDGYLGKRNIKVQSDKTIKSAAVHTLEEFKQQFSEFIIKYHNEPHSGLNGKTPAAVWHESAKKHPPVLDSEIGQDYLLRGLREEKQIKHVTGITTDYQTFNSDELQELYHRSQNNQKPGVKDKVLVTFFRDPLDASAISVLDHFTNRTFEVPNIQGASAAGFSFAEQRVNRRASTTAEEAPVSDQGICEDYDPPQKPRKKGPEVPMDGLNQPLDLDNVINAKSNIISPDIADTVSIHTDEEDDYEITFE